MDNLTTTDNIFLFIAELNGYKAGTVAEKLQFGKDCYSKNTLPEDLHESMWAERHYVELDRAYGVVGKVERILATEVGEVDTSFQWTVPIELDATASLLQVAGVLLGDSTLLEITNVTSNGQLQDAWSVPKLSRNHVKKALTPLLYGSSASPEELWKKNNLEFTAENVLTVTEALNNKYKPAKALKDFIIGNVTPKESMEVVIWNDTFVVECNRFKEVGDTTSQYTIYDTESATLRSLYHTKTRKVADLEQFRLYFQTLLIHNIDSQIADEISRRLSEKYGWVIPIHDAFVIPPQAANDVRKWYAELLEALYADRKTVLSNYFTSIGVTATATAEWEAVKASVTPVKNFKCSMWALK